MRVINFLLVVTVVAVSTAGAQDKYALLVGVETYDTGTFSNLDFAEEDAVELGQALTRLGFSATVMTSNAKSATLKPSTPDKIRTLLKTIIASCGNDDTLIVSLSGHGVQFEDEDLLPSGVKESYFCPEDADLTDKSSLLKTSEVMDLLGDCAAGRKLLLIDSCREEVLSKEGQKKSARRIVLESVHENRRSVPGGMATLFSCSSKQFSWEHDSLKHSVFSNYVIEYLDGRAEARFYDQNEIDLDGLVGYVRKRTNDFVFGKNLSADGQLPILRGSSSNWPFGKLTTRDIVNSIGLKLALIPAGEFMMGSPKSETGRSTDEGADGPHRVQITRPFYLGVYEVTQKEYETVMGATPSYFSATGRGKFSVDDKVTSAFPVESVSWYDAVEFCNKLSDKEGIRPPCYTIRNVERKDGHITKAEVEVLGGNGYRLPTEAEWEYACRAETTTPFHFGTSNNGTQANVDGTVPYGTTTEGPYLVRTTTVGSYDPNRFGLYDMHGNVWEWCEDWYDENFYAMAAATKPNPVNTTTANYRVLRGGSWSLSTRGTRSASRYWNAPGLRSNVDGFRVMRTP